MPRLPEPTEAKPKVSENPPAVPAKAQEPPLLKALEKPPAAPPKAFQETPEIPAKAPKPATSKASQKPPATPPKASKPATPPKAPKAAPVDSPASLVSPGYAKDNEVPHKATPKKRPPPIAPKLSSNAVRVGGGFKLTPKAPAKAKAKVAPRAKATAAAPTPQPEAIDIEAEPEEPEDLVTKMTTATKKTMVTADHFLGLSKFEKAADILEEQLVQVSSETSPLRNSDLHVQLLQKYGAILWWDGDAEGAIDAYAAADEVLTERAEAEKDPNLLLQRAKLWGKAGMGWV
eukprot:Skav233433  [mRNA]  locus=scaffold1486:203981:204847:+ [translate_table: standard]